MKRLITVLIACILILLAYLGTDTAQPESQPASAAAPISTSSVATSSPQENTPSPYAWYPVVKVVDGDTITIEKDGKNVTIRLIGLDTPETVDPRKPVQCFGIEASNEMKQILEGQSVRLEYDDTQDTFDRYGRLLAYVYAPTNRDPAGLLMNSYMIREGYGHEYTYRVPYKYQADFKEAEASAREEKRGLWAEGVCADLKASTVT